MRKDISKFVDDLKDQIVAKVSDVLITGNEKKYKGKSVYIDECSSKDEIYTNRYKIVSFGIEQSAVLVLLEDEDGCQEWTYLRDLSLGDLGRILELL